VSTTKWKSTLRNRLQSSSLRRAYWTVGNRKTLSSSLREEDFYRGLLVGLRRGDIIFDIGANCGVKTDLFLRLGARVVSVEPDEACQQIIRDRFLKYRVKPRPVTLIGKAVSDKVGAEEMWIDGPGSAVNTMNRKWADHLKESKESFGHGHCGLDFSRSKSVETTTIEQMINLYGSPFFIKIDVEGHELNAVCGMRRPVPFLSFEVNLSTFGREGIECVQTLHQLEPKGLFNFTPDCCKGLVLREWLGSEPFCAALESCGEETVEVFWRSNNTPVRSPAER
jgi:FkbM family methyltransferase